MHSNLIATSSPVVILVPVNYNNSQNSYKNKETHKNITRVHKCTKPCPTLPVFINTICVYMDNTNMCKKRLLFKNIPKYISPNEPEPIFRPKRYLLPTRNSILY